MARPISTPVSESDSSTQATVERIVNINVGQVPRERVERVIERHGIHGELLSIEVIIESNMDPFYCENNNISITP